MPITDAGNAWFLVKADRPSDADVQELCTTLKLLPGVREARAQSNSVLGIPTHCKVFIIGTDNGKRLALQVVKIAKIYEPDPNADHDHAACVASAHKMGVPAEWAHRPETYLSM